MKKYIDKRIQGEYKKALKEYKRKIKERPDWIHLDPIETIPLPTGPRIAALGNWGYTALGINKVEKKIKESAKREVVVFVFDTGIDAQHPGLSGFVDGQLSKNFTSDPDGGEIHPHGTHVASTVVGYHKDKPIGIATPLREKRKIRVADIQVLNKSGSGAYAWITDGVRWANEKAKALIEENTFVVYSFSLGGTTAYTPLKEALQQAKQLGVYISAAAGNSYREGVNYPAKYASARAVAAIDSNLNRASFSTYGDEVFISAPGVNILGFVPGGGEASYSGTSMATPHETAIVAILASVWPHWTAGQIDSVIKANSRYLPASQELEKWNKYTGYGYCFLPDFFGDIDEPDEPEPEPEPEPKPDPKPEKPLHPAPRTYTFALDETYNTTVIVYYGPKRQKEIIYITFEVEYTTRNYARDAYRTTAANFAKFFRHRGFLFGRSHDFRDVAYYIAHFVEMLFPKYYGQKLKVKKIQVSDKKRASIFLDYPKQNRKLVKALRFQPGVVTFKTK